MGSAPSAQKYKYDAVWAMMAHGTGVPAGLFKTWNPKVPYLLTLQEGDSIPYIKKKMLPLWPLLYADLLKPIVSSPFQLSCELGARYGIQREY